MAKTPLIQVTSGHKCRSVILLCLSLAARSLAEDGSPVPTLSMDELRAKYALPASRYMDVDGVDLHYVDEGQGQPVLLLHASYHSLRTWDALAERLRANYRVVRFDFPTAGLSIDRKEAPPGGFSMMSRYGDMVAGVVANLDLNSFTLVGTSSGGAVAFRYAGTEPEKVERLILINTAGMPRTPRTDPLRERASFAKWQGMTVRPREFWAFSMAQNFIAPHKPPTWMISQAYDFARREGRAQRAEDYHYSTGNPQTMLGKITSPTLILWGKDNPTVMHLEADVIQHWLTAAPSLIRKYDGLGHYPYVEDLDTIYHDLSAFIAGDLDRDLRQTVMVKPGANCSCANE